MDEKIGKSVDKSPLMRRSNHLQVMARTSTREKCIFWWLR